MTVSWRAAAASAAVYLAVTAWFARDLLWNLGGTIAGDAGDPLFVAAVLHWNATTVPLTESWWQFPIFDPTRDTLAFSEHLLGLSPISTPLHWTSRDPVVTYNLATLLTFPLCGLAMFALVHRLTHNAAAAFLAGLAFAFAPYRISHLPHLQMLALFWAPLAVLGLHAYVESGRRRWLVLYGAAWMLQGGSNAYTLVFLSIFVALWVLWFVAGRRNWAALAGIGVATFLAALPLAPILARYVSVHALHGFTRDLAEMRAYSADLAAVLCAPPQLTFWGWLRTGCRPEGELFPGMAVAAAGLAALFRVSSGSTAGAWLRSPVTLVSRLLLVVGVISAAVACSVMIVGPWAFAFGPLRVSASSIAKPVMLATAAVLLGLVLSPGLRAAAKASSTTAFYLIAALVMWVLALGPTITFMGEPRGFDAPFGWLTHLPGVSGLRVPARFWMLTTMCLAVLVGLVAAPLFERSRRSVSHTLLIAAAALLLMDGWVARFPAAAVPGGVPDARVLQNGTVLTLPVDSFRDIAAGFRAVTGGWRSVNGYSGYFPSYYVALVEGVQNGDEEALVPFLARGDLHVVLSDDAAGGIVAMIERQPGVRVTAQHAESVQYRIPRRFTRPSTDSRGERLRIEDVRGSCEASAVRRVIDDDERTTWECGPQRAGHQLVIDLGRVVPVATVVQNMGSYRTNYPRHLRVQTSLDARTWDAAWDGSVRALLIAQAIERPGPSLRVAVPLAGRPARYVRLTQMATGEELPWTIAEIEVWSDR